MAQKIIVAEGIEIRDFQGTNLIAYLNANADRNNFVWTYPKGAGTKTKYEVEVVFTMAEFAKALDTPNAYVIYEGHSRYGQGPAFGPAKAPYVPDKTAFPINPWGIHFRMGYDATPTHCIADLLAHSVAPAEYDLIRTPTRAFLPKALQRASNEVKLAEKKIRARRIGGNRRCPIGWAWREIDVCLPVLAAFKTAREEQPLKGRHYYGHPWNEVGEYLTAVEVGSADLNKSKLRCKVLFMASCSSKVHFYKSLSRQRKVTKSNCIFYLTHYTSEASHARNFIRTIFEQGVNPTNKPRYHKNRMSAILTGATGSGVVGVY